MFSQFVNATGIILLTLCVVGLFFSVFSNSNSQQEKLLRDIHEELKKKNKQNEPQEGKVI